MNLDADAVRKLARPSEAEFTRQVIVFARLYGWRVAHFRPAVNRRGQWSTPVQGDGAGWPDLFLVNPAHRQAVAAELKLRPGTVTDAQKRWLDALNRAGIRAVVWTPNDWADIEATLKG